MKQLTIYWTTVRVLAYAEGLNIERACSIIKMLNNNVNLFKSFYIKAVRRSKCMLVLVQVVTKIQRSVQDIHNSLMSWVLNDARVPPS